MNQQAVIATPLTHQAADVEKPRTFTFGNDSAGAVAHVSAGIPVPLKAVPSAPEPTPKPVDKYKLVLPADIEKISTRLGVDTEFSGNYKSTKPQMGVAIEGRVSGDFALGEGSFFLLEEGASAVDCTIKASTVLILGNFSGTIVAEKLEVSASAVITGAMHYAEIVIQRGAKVSAEHHMQA